MISNKAHPYRNQDLLICTACGTEFDQPANDPLPNCVICDDPRQFVPPTGQKWTSQSLLSKNHHNTITPLLGSSDLWSIATEPKFGIGQRAVLIATPGGNVLWDCLTLLDPATVDFIRSKGGLKAIVISHPHYYTTHLRWAQTFNCPIYIAAEDAQWCQRADSQGWRKPIKGETQEIIPGVTALKLGGHFPGSLVLHYAPASGAAPRLFIADTFVTTPSAIYHVDRPEGTTSYAFMWSIPNMIPLGPEQMLGMWKTLRSWNFGSTHGAFVGQEVVDGDERQKGAMGVKARVLESMRIQARGEGWSEERLEAGGVFAWEWDV